MAASGDLAEQVSCVLTQHQDHLLQLPLLHGQIQLPRVETQLLPPAEEGGDPVGRWALSTAVTPAPPASALGHSREQCTLTSLTPG